MKHLKYYKIFEVKSFKLDDELNNYLDDIRYYLQDMGLALYYRYAPGYTNDELTIYIVKESIRGYRDFELPHSLAHFFKLIDIQDCVNTIISFVESEKFILKRTRFKDANLPIGTVNVLYDDDNENDTPYDIFDVDESEQARKCFMSLDYRIHGILPKYRSIDDIMIINFELIFNRIVKK